MIMNELRRFLSSLCTIVSDYAKRFHDNYVQEQNTTKTMIMNQKMYEISYCMQQVLFSFLAGLHLSPLLCVLRCENDLLPCGFNNVNGNIFLQYEWSKTSTDAIGISILDMFKSRINALIQREKRKQILFYKNTGNITCPEFNLLCHEFYVTSCKDNYDHIIIQVIFK